MTACMGGFKCAKRAACRHYHAEDRSAPIERLCEVGKSDAFEPVVERGNRIRAQAAAIVKAGAGDELLLQWARRIVAHNPRPIVAPLEADEKEWIDV